MPDLTPADRLALAVCKFSGKCEIACPWCRQASAKVSTQLATILRERYGSSATADWLDGIPTMPSTASALERERTGDPTADQAPAGPGGGAVVAK